MDDGLSPEVRSFVLQHIDSVEMLDVLLLLASQPDIAFTAERVSQRLRTSASSAESRLKALSREQVIERTSDGAYSIGGKSRHRAIIDEVARSYLERGIRVVALIYSRPSDLVTVFDRALALEKEPPNDDER